MAVEVRGYFNLKDNNKTFIVLDSVRNEIGTVSALGNKLIVELDADDPIHFENERELEHWFEENNYILTTDSTRFVHYNPNPNGNEKATDCTIRAYCAAQDIKWDEAYDIACQYGKSNAFMPNDKSVCDIIMEEEFGMVQCKLDKEEKGCTVKQFAIAHPTGTYICVCGGHLVAVIDGQYYDTWDSGKKKVRYYFSK